MSTVTFMDLLREWFSRDNLPNTLGYVVAIICAIIILTELYTVITQKNEPDFIYMLLAVVFAGIVQGLTADILLAVLVALCWLMLVSLWTIRESPVWRELMLSSLISYVIVLGGRIIQRVMETRVANRSYDILTYTKLGLTGQQWFGLSWNIFIYVFFILCIIFFGRRFFLVSRLTSPQIIYLLLFALSYFILYQFSGENGLNFYYPGMTNTALADRLLFASFGTYEIMIIANILLYLISGPLLHVIFGVKKVKDERVLNLVEEVRQKLNIRSKIRVGKVKAPILNAFAFGAFFDKRITFMSDELDDFTDDDIRGIAGHELVHSKKIHTFWLLIITALTFAITKALNLPATTFDYIFNPDVGFEFLWYYLYNIALMALSYIFVRFLEGRADKLTMDAGYGKPLAKALVKLDGFYQGIASEMGLSVYLLTNKKQTAAEKVRFLGDAGRNMYNNYIKPSYTENFVNLIASHPKSAYRVMALTKQEKLRPFKAAMLPFFLVIPFIRKIFVKEIQEIKDDASVVINETFLDDYPKNGVNNYDNLTHLSYQYDYLKGKNIVAISKLADKCYYLGKVKDIKLTDKVTSPVSIELTTKDGVKLLPISDYTPHEFDIDQKQVFKNGKIGVIKEVHPDLEKFSFMVEYTNNGSTELKEMKLPGIPIRYFEDVAGKNIYLLQKGITKLAKLESIKFKGDSFADSELEITVGNQTKIINGDKFVVDFKPFDIYLKKNKEEIQRPIIDSLKGLPVSLQTKDDLDTLVKGTVTSINDETMELETLNEIKEVNIKRIEFLYIYEDSLMLIYKPSLSFIDRLLMALQNRTEIAYIIP
ncbi:MAG: M48 family metalloprotease [Asgard group archaeon]|nr:M48 family metalloprotease [Asgard group archaeon]